MYNLRHIYAWVKAYIHRKIDTSVDECIKDRHSYVGEYGIVTRIHTCLYARTVIDTNRLTYSFSLPFFVP